MLQVVEMQESRGGCGGGIQSLFNPENIEDFTAVTDGFLDHEDLDGRRIPGPVGGFTT